jgi:aspartate racemase
MADPAPPGASRIVGILGGMGPAATVDFYAKLVRHTPAERDQDHLRVVIWADPSVPNRQEALLAGGTDPTPWLENGVSRLVASGAEIVVVPCNTVHAYLEPVMAAAPVEFIDIIDVTVDAVRRRGVARVGLLATDGALASGLFQDAFDSAGIEWVLPDSAGQESVMDLVTKVKTGRVDDETREQMRRRLESLRDAGAVTVVAGCTEISALLDGMPIPDDVGVLDPATELALRTLARACAG